MRLFITGPTGSGKTTLATKIAVHENVRSHSLDNIHWVLDPSGDYRRSSEERAQMLEKIVQENDWIIEGVQFKWADAAIIRADYIVVLDIPQWRNRLRILHRFITRRRSAPAGTRGTLKALRQEIGWPNDYYLNEREILFAKLAKHQEKVIVLNKSDTTLSPILRFCK